MPRRVVPAAQALPSEGAAVVSVAIAVAGLAAGKAPEAGQAAVALPPIHPREAVALACLCVAEGVVRASGMALARSASTRPEPKGARGASVALSSDDVGTTLALSSAGVTH